MRLKSRTLSFLISFLLGTFWALTLLGAIAAFVRHLDGGVLYALASMVVWAIPGLFGVVLMEVFLAAFERTEELRHQTRLLKEIKQRLDSRSDR
jgi:hypothetical protein